MPSAAKETKPKASVRTTVSVPADDYAELEQIAKRKKVSVAWVVRDCIDRFLRTEAPLFRGAEE